MQKISTNTLIIGGGPAGYPAAIRLGQLKIQTALVEKDALGGTCLNVGCIPSKALIGIASKYHASLNDWLVLGLDAKKSKLNWPAAIDWKDKLVAKTSGGVKSLLKANNVQQLSGHCRILGPNSCQIDDKYQVNFENLIIATGSKVVELPKFKFNKKEILNSSDLLSLKQVPKSMIILGGGIIGMELGTLYASLGCQVTIVEMLPRILINYEKEASAIVHKSFEELGGKILTATKALSWKKNRSGAVALKILHKDKESEINAEKLAVTVGRCANFDGLNLAALDIKIENGCILVNDKMQSSLPHIYAAGDVVAGPMLAHKATAEGVLAAEAIAGHKVSRRDIKVIPDVVYTKPEIAQVGYNEDQARDKGIEIKIGKFPLTALGMAATSLETKGYVKYIAEANSHRILGVSVVSYQAASMISEAALAIEMGAYLEDVAFTVHPHPSFGEAHMEAALAGLSQAIHIVNR